MEHILLIFNAYVLSITLEFNVINIARLNATQRANKFNLQSSMKVIIKKVLNFRLDLVLNAIYSKIIKNIYLLSTISSRRKYRGKIMNINWRRKIMDRLFGLMIQAYFQKMVKLYIKKDFPILQIKKATKFYQNKIRQKF